METEELLKQMEPALNTDKTVKVTSEGFFRLYLAIVRLRDLEKFAEAGDWESIKLYTPVEPDNRS